MADNNNTPVPQGHTTPFSLPDDVSDATDPTHPDTDTNPDATEVYNDGLGKSVGLDPPPKSDVTDYEPKDHKPAA